MSSGVSLFALGPLALAARSFLRRSERRLTVIAKVTARIVHDGPLTATAPRPIVAGERYLSGPVSSVVHPGDLALRMPRAQLMVVGSAYAPGGEPTTTGTVRLAVARGESMLLDKRLEVVGDRRGPARTSSLGGAQLVESASPFVRMPVVYERAFGGAGIARNPVGTGAHADDDGQAVLPNLHHANGRIAQDPAGFGPISSLWPARREMLGGTPRQAADREIDASLEADFPDAYFLAAPADQQIDAWQGGEMIALFQMHPTLPALRTHVPRWIVSAVLQTARGVRVPVPMKLDTILIEPEAMVAELTFRGDVRVDDEALRGARVGATLAADRVELPDLASRGPGAPADAFALGEGAGHSTPPPPERRARDATLVLEGATASGAEAATRATPLEPRRARAGTMVMEVEAPAPPRPPPAAPPPIAIHDPDDPDDEAPATQVMPTEAPKRERVATLSIDLDEPKPASLPFRQGARAERPASPAAPLPGAPWSPGAFKRPKPTRPGLDETLADESTADDPSPKVKPTAVAPAPLPSAPEPSPAPPPPAPPPPAPPPPAPPPPAPPPPPAAAPPKAEDAKPKPLWREDPPEPAAPAPNVRAPRSRVSFKSDLYKKIKK